MESKNSILKEMMGKLGIVVVVVVILVALAVGVISLQPSLDKLQQDIERDHQGVLHINAQEYEGLNEEDVVLFDVREQAEFEVGHIGSAVQISPAISAQDFRERYGELLEDKVVVFYCSVGRRSSDALSRLSTVLADEGATQVANLQGGIFSWANQQKEIVGGKVHPYNRYWGRLIEDSSKIAYQPSGDHQDDEE